MQDEHILRPIYEASPIYEQQYSLFENAKMTFLGGCGDGMSMSIALVLPRATRNF